MQLLLTGVLIGVVAASVVWAVIIGAGKKKQNARKQEREQVMLTVGGLLADADAFEASFRSGSMTRAYFARGMSEKVGAIWSQLRTNMHVLEVFFVKYAEQQVQEYMRLIDNPERRRGVPAADAQRVAAEAADVADAAGESLEEDAVDIGYDQSAVAAIPVAKTDKLPDIVGGSGYPRGETMPPEQQDIEPAQDDRIDDQVYREPPADDDDSFVIPDVSPAAPEAEEPVVTPDDDAFEVPSAEIAESAPEPEPEQADEPQVAAAVDSWSEPSLEDYEAEFAKIEEQAEPEELPAVEDSAEDVVEELEEDFSVSVSAPEPEESAVEPITSESTAEEDAFAEEELFAPAVVAETPAVPEPEAVAEPVAEDEDEEELFDLSSAAPSPAPAPAPVAEPVAEEHPASHTDTSIVVRDLTPAELNEEEMTETIAFDRTSVLAGYARAPISPEAAAPAPAAAAPAQAPEQAGITGDDIVDSIDNLFKLKS